MKWIYWATTSQWLVPIFRQSFRLMCWVGGTRVGLWLFKFWPISMALGLGCLWQYTEASHPLMRVVWILGFGITNITMLIQRAIGTTAYMQGK